MIRFLNSYERQGGVMCYPSLTLLQLPSPRAFTQSSTGTRRSDSPTTAASNNNKAGAYRHQRGSRNLSATDNQRERTSENNLRQPLLIIHSYLPPTTGEADRIQTSESKRKDTRREKHYQRNKTSILRSLPPHQSPIGRSPSPVISLSTTIQTTTTMAHPPSTLDGASFDRSLRRPLQTSGPNKHRNHKPRFEASTDWKQIREEQQLSLS
jgi:hypothetical protein